MQQIFKRHSLKYHKYADDIQLYASYNPAKPGDQVETARRLTECFGEVRRWMAVLILKLNDEKNEHDDLYINTSSQGGRRLLVAMIRFHHHTA